MNKCKFFKRTVVNPGTLEESVRFYCNHGGQRVQILVCPRMCRKFIEKEK